jgi:intracellular sulfur oxidation DsrE/DsrF family protein
MPFFFNLNMRNVLVTLAFFVLNSLFSMVAAQDKVAYHFDDSIVQATRGLRSVRNHLDAAPDTKIVVVAIGSGIDFLLEGAKDKANLNIEYAAWVSDLKTRGVKFEVCEITLRSRELKKEQFILDADFTPSGVARIAQLQSREHYGYIKP